MSMNVQQRIVLWLGVVVFTLLTLRPHWVGVWNSPFTPGVHREQELGSQFVWHNFALLYTSVHVDFQRLILEWLVVGVIMSALLWTFAGLRNWRLGVVTAFFLKGAAATRVALLQTFKKRIVHVGFLIAGLLLMTTPVAFRWTGWRWQAKLYEERVAEFERRIPQLARAYPVIQSIDRSGGLESQQPGIDLTAGLERSIPSIAEQRQIRTATPGGVIAGAKRGNKAPDTLPADFVGWDSAKPASTPFTVIGVENPFDVPGVGVVFFPDSMSGHEVAAALRTKYPHSPAWYLDAIAADVNLAAVSKDEKPGDPPGPFSAWDALQGAWVRESLGLLPLALAVGLFVATRPAQHAR